MNKLRGAMLLIAALFAIGFAITRQHGSYAVILVIVGVLVGLVGVMRLVQKS